ncbi:MAG: deoxyribose-phosphate aldolase [Lachnospiraceae bacterium]|nr:deoxyribose-phosphate aldolase [Lachnospiraceae bacterium]
MELREILQHVDHTLLAPTATWEEIQHLAEEAMEYHTASICIPPCYIKPVKEKYGDAVNICTVIGFPLGYSTMESKVKEAMDAVADGAREVDMVINIAKMKNHEYSEVLSEMKAIRGACEGVILKCIIETCYLTEEEKVECCHMVTEAGIDYIKTSTGFGTAGATLEDVQLFAANIGPKVKIKAAGGIRTKEFMEELLEAGADRLGCSAAVKLAKG